MRSDYLRVSCRVGSLLLATVLMWTALPAWGQPAAAEPVAPAAQKAEKFRGRLPSYYRQVVDEKQRNAIYKIQEEYASKIADLKAQLAAMTKQRDEKITATLTPEQLDKIEKLKTEAQQKRKTATEKKPAKPASSS
ncbi:MAG: hypothetical protein HQ567_25890 [Candidatus Nealsonbacteria bacterium]|nr:hypothetical protein [Candidatus Nealsonbacteria bacterium]